MFIIFAQNYVQHNMRVETKIQQYTISTERNGISNYMILIEIIDECPKQLYIVPMNDFQFYDETMPYYVINKN
jgi:hypothetical protein